MGTIDRDRDAQAAGMRRDGKSYQQIAYALGMGNRASAWKAVSRHYERQNVVMGTEVKDVYADRLEFILTGNDQNPGGLLAMAASGDLEAAKLAEKYMRRQAELYDKATLRTPNQRRVRVKTTADFQADEMDALQGIPSPERGTIEEHDLTPPADAFDDDDD